MSGDPVLAAIEALGVKLSGEIAEPRTGMMGRMDRLQDEWFVAYAQHEGLGRRIDNARSETTDIRDQISGLVRQVRALRDRLNGLEGP